MQPNDEIDYKYYLDDIKIYKQEFESAIQEIYNLINEDVTIQQIEARIKSYKSFSKNLYSSTEKLKNLDDCFGIKMMLPDDDGIKKVIDKLKNAGYSIRQIKDHKKKANTNYNAVHAILELKDSQIPFEIQLRTPERAEGRLPHDLYKLYGAKNNITHTDKIRVAEEFVRLAKMKMNGQYNLLIQEIPICYRIEDGKLVRLNTKEIIRNLFPTAEEVFGKKLFGNILDKLFIEGIQERKDTMSEENKKMLNILFDCMLEKTGRELEKEYFDYSDNNGNEEK